MQCFLKSESIAFIRIFFLFHILSLSFLVSREKFIPKYLGISVSSYLEKEIKAFRIRILIFLQIQCNTYWEPFSRIPFQKIDFFWILQMKYLINQIIYRITMNFLASFTSLSFGNRN